MLSEWLSDALHNSDMSGSELARQLTARLGRSIDRAAVNKMKSGKRKIAGDELLEIEKLTGWPAPKEGLDEIDTVPLMGYVGAGALYVPFQVDAPIDRVTAPEGANEATVAVEIRGSSLGPLFDRWLVFYDDVKDPPSRDMIGKLCVAGLDDGRIVVKQLDRAQIPGCWNLLSNFEAPIYDAIVLWAAQVKTMSPR